MMKDKNTNKLFPTSQFDDDQSESFQPRDDIEGIYSQQGDSNQDSQQGDSNQEPSTSQKHLQKIKISVMLKIVSNQMKKS